MGPGQVVGPPGWSGTSLETLAVVRDGSGDPQGSLGWVERLSGWSGTVRWTLGEVREGSRDPVKFPGRVVGPSVKFGTGP